MYQNLIFLFRMNVTGKTKEMIEKTNIGKEMSYFYPTLFYGQWRE